MERRLSFGVKAGIWLSGFVLLLGAAFAGYHYWRHTHVLTVGVPPKVNPDGTVDYTILLVDRQAKGKCSVICLPDIDKWTVRLPGNIVPGRTKAPGPDGRRPESFSSKDNKTITFRLSWPDLKPFSAYDSQSSKAELAEMSANDIVHVTLDFAYRSNPKPSRFNSVGLEARKKECKYLGKNSFGLHEFENLEPNLESFKNVPYGKISGRCPAGSGYMKRRVGAKAYASYQNWTGVPIRITCDEIDAICKAYTSYQRQAVHLEFPNQLVERWQTVIKDVQKFISEATLDPPVRGGFIKYYKL